MALTAGTRLGPYAITAQIGVGGMGSSQGNYSIRARPRPYNIMLSLVAITLSLSLTACSGDSDSGGSGIDPENLTGPTGASLPSGTSFSMATPYVNSADMAEIGNGFSPSTNGPWGFAADNIAFVPNRNLNSVSFQAVAPGSVERVESREGDVVVAIFLSTDFIAEYSFVPGSSDPADSQAQRGNVLVSTGQAVQAGQVIGRRLVRGEFASVLFRLIQRSAGFSSVCPEPLFTQAARESILSLLRIRYPNANICM